MWVGGTTAHCRLSTDLAASLPGTTYTFEEGSFLFSEGIDTGARGKVCIYGLGHSGEVGAICDGWLSELAITSLGIPNLVHQNHLGCFIKIYIPRTYL